jgi:hypothetical protein
MSADAPATAAATPQAAAPARQPDGYPNLNIVPKPANAQITDAEKAALIDELSAKRPQAGGTAAKKGKAPASFAQDVYAIILRRGKA